MSGFSGVRIAVEAMRSGRMVIVADHDKDTATGNLVLGASVVNAEAINFMTTEGRGLIQVAMSAARLDGLGIQPSDSTATGPTRERFRISVDAAGSSSPGVTARGRADTIRALIDPAACAEDFTRPGYVFPIGCEIGGLLTEVGKLESLGRWPEPAGSQSVATVYPPKTHELSEPTALGFEPRAPRSKILGLRSEKSCSSWEVKTLQAEAAIELAVSASLEPAAVLCEICASDGELASLPALREFGRIHDIPVITIADLVDYRRDEMCRVRRAGEARIPLEAGTFRAIGYVDGTGREHLALSYGDPDPRESPLTRVQLECLLGDVFGSQCCDCRDHLRRSLARIAEAGSGTLVYVREPADTVSRTSATCPHASPNVIYRNRSTLKTLRSAAYILADLGLDKIRLLVGAAESVDLPGDITVAGQLELISNHPPDQH